MITRLYFLVPDVEHAKQIVDELLLARIEQRCIRVLAKEDTPLEDLPEAGFAEKTDFINAMERGVAAGGITGLLAGLVAVTFPPASLALAGGAVLLLTTLAGAGFGAWAASLIGVSLPNSELKRFEKAIQAGQVLILVDVPDERVDEVTKLIRKHHPGIELTDVDPECTLIP